MKPLLPHSKFAVARLPPACALVLTLGVSTPACQGGKFGLAAQDTSACNGVVCASPPSNECQDADVLIVYSATGTCSDGNCNYGDSTLDCPLGCSGGACQGDPCIGVTCTTPPANNCQDASTLLVYNATGTCSDGNCNYASSTQDCPIGCACGVCGVDPCGTTELEVAANSLSAGQWISLQTNDINAVLGATGSSGFVFGYTDDIVWDPISRQLFFLGGDHTSPAHFISYTEQTNTWQRLPRESWFYEGGSSANHGYDHNAIDPAGRAFFHREFSDSSVRRYDITNGTWTQSPSFYQDINYVTCCAGVEYFPELQGVVYSAFEGAIIWKDGTSLWEVLSPPVAMGSYHSTAEYNPVHKVLVFGGGTNWTPDGDDYSQSKKLYKLDGAGNVTALNIAPVNLGIQDTILTVDPVSGEYLVFTKNKAFYVFDVVTDTWTLQSVAPPIWPTGPWVSGVHGAVATPLSTHGVNLFVTCDGRSDCRVTLYRHTGG